MLMSDCLASYRDLRDDRERDLMSSSNSNGRNEEKYFLFFDIFSNHKLKTFQYYFLYFLKALSGGEWRNSRESAAGRYPHILMTNSKSRTRNT